MRYFEKGIQIGQRGRDIKKGEKGLDDFLFIFDKSIEQTHNLGLLEQVESPDGQIFVKADKESPEIVLLIEDENRRMVEGKLEASGHSFPA
jgi:hypothetical protein